MKNFTNMIGFTKKMGFQLAIAAGVVCGLTAAPAMADDACAGADEGVVLTQVAGNQGYYQAGGTVQLDVTVCYTGDEQLTQLGVAEFLPDGWTFSHMNGGTVPPIHPQMGDEGELSFAWIYTPDSFPLTFSFVANVDEASTGQKILGAYGIYGFDGPQYNTDFIPTLFNEGVAPEPEGEEEGEYIAPEVTCEDATDGVVMIRTVEDNLYVPGHRVAVTVNFCYTGDDDVLVLGLEETLPEGWTFAGFAGGQAPPIAPGAGDEGTLSFAYIFTPTFPVSFTYLADVPLGTTGTQIVAGAGLYAFSGPMNNTNNARTALEEGEYVEEVEGEDEGEEEVIEEEPVDRSRHTADQDANNNIDLSEMLRVIQFYNSDGLGCKEGTEDGYEPSIDDDFDCVTHAIDYAPQDWFVSLSELLRLVQLYNSNGYHYCPDSVTEDGYCPGAAS